MVSVCSSVAVARAAVSEHWEGEFLSFILAVTRAAVSACSSVAVARAAISVHIRKERVLVVSWPFKCSGQCVLRSWSTSLAVTCAAAVSVCSSIAVARAAVSVH